MSELKATVEKLQSLQLTHNEKWLYMCLASSFGDITTDEIYLSGYADSILYSPNELRSGLEALKAVGLIEAWPIPHTDAEAWRIKLKDHKEKAVEA